MRVFRTERERALPYQVRHDEFPGPQVAALSAVARHIAIAKFRAVLRALLAQHVFHVEVRGIEVDAPVAELARIVEVGLVAWPHVPVLALTLQDGTLIGTISRDNLIAVRIHVA